MIEFSFSPPFFRRMPEQSLYFSERLRLITYFGKSGRPKKHRIELIWKAKGMYGDSCWYICFPAADQKLKDILKQRDPRKIFWGSYDWSWQDEGTTLLVQGDSYFHLRSDEVAALIKILFPEGT